MKLCRFYLPDSGVRLGLWQGEQVYDLTASPIPHFASLTALLHTPNPASCLDDISPNELPVYPLTLLDGPPDPHAPHLLPPIDNQEVWAAGVTYAWSREARVREAISKEIYVKVYEAERPELFFKSLPHKVVGPRDWVGIRGDSRWNVPEPELALVLDPQMRIVGYTIGNDMSSRDIEGENPLYLPQAKVYRHSCALGPGIVLTERLNAAALPVRLEIWRGGEVAFRGETSTAQIHRRLQDLAAWLGRYNDFPHGAVLLTGTGIVPGDQFSLQDGDEVRIEIGGIGVLCNPVRQM